ncbi:Cdc6/Cdc18 family protein [Halorarius litoreus]|uniref:Cdc6/Cdc18 family protein n=1 Tax=Halorarius litoreus TaxID=2962676 RepID=UPI0020CC8CBF|nr:Cdc6/Cdc18 family protein [Halorarius litoreus]
MLHNARALDADWVPGDIVHRNVEKNRLRDALEPVLDGEKPQDLLIDGPSGAGKTCLARYTTERLQEQALGVETKHVDCWNHSKRFRVLLDLLDGVAPTHDIHRNTPQDEMLARLETLDRPYVVILDEVDQLEDKNLLRELWSIPEITMILIANREADILDTLDERVRSRLRGSVRVHFGRYTQDELVAILRARADAGLRPGTISSQQLEHIADAAAGNARDAIIFLRQAAQEADWDGATEITDSHIHSAIPEAKDNLRQRSLDKLTDDQRLVYDILLEHGSLMPKDVYAKYEQRADEPKTNRTVRKYLSKLDHYGLVESEGDGPSRRYHPNQARS